jgi:hypothetical protein
MGYSIPPSPPWSQDTIDTASDLFISDYSWCTSSNLGTLNLDGSTSCFIFEEMRSCEASYLIERCGEAIEHQYIAGDLTQAGYYAKCSSQEEIHCWPISHWMCPECPNCQPNDPNFIGCLEDTAQNRDRLGNEACSFQGNLSGSTPCQVFDELKECIRKDCEAKCEQCEELLSGFYVLCDNNGTIDCRPHGYWICADCDVSPKTGCKQGSEPFNPSFIDVPISVVGGGGNPTALTVRIPLNKIAAANNNQYTDGSIRVPSSVDELAPANAAYQVLNINGQPPYNTGFEIKNIKVELDNISGKLNVSFEASLFYCGPGYKENNDLYICPPQKFKSSSSNPCLDCAATNIIKA